MRKQHEPLPPNYDKELLGSKVTLGKDSGVVSVTFASDGHTYEFAELSFAERMYLDSKYPRRETYQSSTQTNIFGNFNDYNEFD